MKQLVYAFLIASLAFPADKKAETGIGFQTQDLPNPDARDIYLDRTVTDSGETILASFKPEDPPLIKALLKVDSVVDVFMKGKVVTVIKKSSASWESLMPKVVKAFSEHFHAAMLEKPPLKAIKDFHDLP